MSRTAWSRSPIPPTVACPNSTSSRRSLSPSWWVTRPEQGAWPASPDRSDLSLQHGSLRYLRGQSASAEAIGAAMTTKSDFSAEEWQLILEAPPSAGMIVVTAQRGGMFRETIAIAKAYAEAREQHGQSELLDEIVSAKPERDHTHSTLRTSSNSTDCSTFATRSRCLNAR